MNQFKTSSDLKSLARGQLKGNYAKMISALSVHLFILLSLQSMILSLFSADTLINNIAYYVAMFLLSLFSGLFIIAENFIYLKLSCRYPFSFKDIFWGIRFEPDRTIKIQFLFAILHLICILPANTASYLLKEENTLIYYFVSICLLLFGNFCYLLICLSLQPALYLAIDFKDYSVSKIYQLSRSIMKGHKMRLLYIKISFWPLYLLGILSFGIGFLWILPYKYATEANFYLDLISNRNKELLNQQIIS